MAACSGQNTDEDSSTNSGTGTTWPTEQLNGEAGAVKSLLFESIESGHLEAATAEQIFVSSFRGENFQGEDFYLHPGDTGRIESGISLSSWGESPANLGSTAFLERWNAYLQDLGDVETLEVHTWEIQLRQQGEERPGLETREAVWILARQADGRLREDRLYLILDLVQTDNGWKIASVRSSEGRTTVAPGPFFHDVTTQSLPPGYDQSGTQIYTDGGPVFADFDADGDIDLFLPRLHAPARLYENDGSGHFDDVTAARGLELNTLRQDSNSGLFVDLDRDGWLDLVVGLKRRGLLLFRNEGGDGAPRRFRDVSSSGSSGSGSVSLSSGSTTLARAGEWESLAAADYDGDGWVDIYHTNYNLIDAEHQPETYVDARDGLPNVLWRNLGAGDGAFRFADTTLDAGLGPGSERWSYAASWADYDRDGDLDLFVANDYGPNSFYRNLGAGAEGSTRFEEIASKIGAEDHGNGMGLTWADLDGDLWLDAYISNMQSFAGNRITRLENFPGSDADRALYRRFSKGNTLLRNLGGEGDRDVGFEDVTEQAGVKGAFWAWGNLAFDYDADTDLDLFVCGGFYTGASAKDT